MDTSPSPYDAPHSKLFTVCISIFGFVDQSIHVGIDITITTITNYTIQSKPCTQIYLEKIFTTPSRTFRPIVSLIGLFDIKIPQKKLFPQTTHGRTLRITIIR